MGMSSRSRRLKWYQRRYNDRDGCIVLDYFYWKVSLFLAVAALGFAFHGFAVIGGYAFFETAIQVLVALKESNADRSDVFGTEAVFVVVDAFVEWDFDQSD